MTLAILDANTSRKKEAFYPWPIHSSEEQAALSEVVRGGNWGGYGGEIERFESLFRSAHNAKHAIACANGTVALEVALRSAGVRCGDEVIVSPFTFISSASAILLCHAVPVFVDIDHETMNISAEAIERAITPRSKAVVVVHFGGHPADMDTICAVAMKHRLAIIEDCAHAHGAKWKGVPVGTFGTAGAFSFQAFKLITAGEGGIIVSNDDTVAEAAWSYCNQGRRRGTPWYEHYSLGTNYRMTAFQAAILIVQLQRLPEQTAMRVANATYLRSRLKDFRGLRTAEPSNDVQDHPHYLMTLRYDPSEFSGVSRDLFLAAVRAEGVPLNPVYPHPLYRNQMFQADAMRSQSCRSWSNVPDYSSLYLEESERICNEGLWLEHRLFLGPRADMDEIVTVFQKVQQNSVALAKYGRQHHVSVTR